MGGRRRRVGRHGRVTPRAGVRGGLVGWLRRRRGGLVALVAVGASAALVLNSLATASARDWAQGRQPRRRAAVRQGRNGRDGHRPCDPYGARALGATIPGGPPPWVERSVEEVVRAAGATTCEVRTILRRGLGGPVRRGRAAGSWRCWRQPG